MDELIEIKIENAKIKKDVEVLQNTIVEFRNLFEKHDIKEMEKYDKINKSINDLQVTFLNQNWKMTIGLGLFLAVVGGIVNLDKLIGFLGMWL